MQISGGQLGHQPRNTYNRHDALCMIYSLGFYPCLDLPDRMHAASVRGEGYNFSYCWTRQPRNVTTEEGTMTPTCSELVGVVWCVTLFISLVPRYLSVWMRSRRFKYCMLAVENATEFFSYTC